MNPLESGTSTPRSSENLLRNQVILNAAKGAVLGLCAPFGWLVIDVLFFRSSDSTFMGHIAHQLTGGGKNTVLLLYMLVGTSTSMAVFGALIGRKNMGMIIEERKMSETYKLFMAKEEQFERRHYNLRNRMQGITQISASIQRSANMDEVFRLCAEGIHDILDFDRINIFLANKETGMLECVETKGNLDEPIENIRLPLDERGGILYLSLKNGRPFIIRDPDEMKPEYRIHQPYDSIKAIRSRSFMIIPFHDGKEPIGLFGVDNKFKKEPINEEEVDIIKVMADQVSVAISNIRLIHGIRRMDDLMDQAFNTIKAKRERYSVEIQKLALATTDLRESADTLTGNAEEILTFSEKEARVAEEFDKAGVEVASSMDELMSSMDEIAHVAENMKKTLEIIREKAEESAGADDALASEVQEGIGAFQKTREGIEVLKHTSDSFTRTMEELAMRSREVKEMIQVIDEIMDQTKLLALNASIIAAQAGSQGKAFAVVAEEIGKLSREVETSTGAIRGAMDSYDREVIQVVDETARIKQEVENAVENNRSMEGVFARISKSFEKSHDMSLSIRDETQSQSEAAVGVTETAGRIRNFALSLKDGADRQRAHARIITEATENMRNLSHSLTQTARVNQEGSRTLIKTVSGSEQVFETLFVSLQEWRELGRQLLKELEAFGV